MGEKYGRDCESVGSKLLGGVPERWESNGYALITNPTGYWAGVGVVTLAGPNFRSPI